VYHVKGLLAIHDGDADIKSKFSAQILDKKCLMNEITRTGGSSCP
jgi:hypothetical protein